MRHPVLVWSFHGFRIIAALFLAGALARFLSLWLPPEKRAWAWTVAYLGGGLGKLPGFSASGPCPSGNGPFGLFYQGELTAEQQREWLRQWGIRWVFYGPAERRLGFWHPNQVHFLSLRVQVGEYALYEVVP